MTSPQGATRHEPPELSTDETADGGPPRVQRGTLLAVASVVVPPLAWLSSLAASYVVQDFVCSAFESAARPGPDGTVRVLITIINVLLLVLTVLTGWAGWTRWRHGSGGERFLGLVGAGMTPVFVLGIVLIALPPFLLEVCP